MPKRRHAAAGVAPGSAVGHGAMVHTGTPLAPRLLDIARDAAGRAASATAGSNDELDGCLVAILCGHAAVEARLNETVEYSSPSPALLQWWDDREALKLEAKWTDLVERQTGTRPTPGSKVRNGIVRRSRPWGETQWPRSARSQRPAGRVARRDHRCPCLLRWTTGDRERARCRRSDSHGHVAGDRSASELLPARTSRRPLDGDPLPPACQ